MRAIRTALVVLSVVAFVAPTAGAASGLLTQPVDADVVVMTADVDQRGDAAWAVTYRVRLATDSDETAFDDIQADIGTNTTAYTDRFRDRMTRTARTAENATGREMAIENVSVETTRETFSQTYGVITYRFEWRNFAAVSDRQITVGDALAGLFLDSGTSLTLRWPAAYEADTITPAPDEETDRSATWRGQRSFATDEPRVAATAGASGPDSGLLAGVVAAVVIIAGALLWRRRDTAATPDDEGSQQDREADQTPPADLLSNEEQVLNLLEDNGGRLKQQQVAAELNWTDAKTSQVIGDLREADQVETFRIGRENVVTLPGTDLTEESDDST